MLVNAIVYSNSNIIRFLDIVLRVSISVSIPQKCSSLLLDNELVILVYIFKKWRKRKK